MALLSSLKVVFKMEASNSYAHKMTGRCCFIFTLNPIVACASLRHAAQAYLVSTLLTTLDANKPLGDAERAA